MTWSVIVVAKGMWSVTEQFLNTLIETTPNKVLELIYIDNGSPDRESWLNFCIWSVANKDKIVTRPVLLEDSVNLSKAWNLGYQMSTQYKILICNNDLIFHKSGWLEAFENELQNQEVGIVGMTGMSWQNVAFIQGSIFAFRLERFLAHGELGFDERFLFTCEEVDFNHRVQLDGYKIRPLDYLKGEYIEHLEGATRNYYKDDLIEYQRLAHISRLEFCYKWLGTLGRDDINIHD